MQSIPKFKLNNGQSIPALGLGTFQVDPKNLPLAVEHALKVGYRHLDGAAVYNNEPTMGQILAKQFKKGALTRKDIFITSKLWNSAHHKDDVEQACDQTLKDLQLDTLDLYLIHWPIAFTRGISSPSKPEDFAAPDQLPYEETWEAMENLVEKGKVKSIGVSNFNQKKLEKILAYGRMTPAVLQIEGHPYLQQPELIDFCQEHDIHVTAYSPLGSPGRSKHLRHDNEPTLMEDDVILEIAKKHNATPGQVLIRWAIQRGTSTIPKSINPKRIEENFKSLSITLDEADIERIRQMDKQYRYINPQFFFQDGSPYSESWVWEDA
jgi:alcohol dehydrogenase (NADP+)